MVVGYNCNSCRFHDLNNNFENKSHCRYCFTANDSDQIPSEWAPKLKAQILMAELDKYPHGKLIGNFDTGYLYELTKKDIEYMKKDIEYMKNYIKTIKESKKYLNERFGLASIERKEYNKMYKNKSPRQKALERIKKVIFNDPCTIVFWNDGTKTVVKCGEDDIFDPEKGLAMAISKYFFDNQGYFNDVFKKFIPEEKELEMSATQRKESLKNIPNTQKGLYSVKELAELSGCSEASILKDIKKGKFPGAKKEHGKWVIPCEF